MSVTTKYKERSVNSNSHGCFSQIHNYFQRAKRIYNSNYGLNQLVFSVVKIMTLNQ